MLKKEMKRLPEAELRVMMAVWKTGDLSSASHILRNLDKDWPLSTLMTVLSRLADKGCLRLEKRGRNNLYSALVTEDEYKRLEGKNILESLFQNSMKNFVTTLYGGGAADQKGLEELREYLDSLGREHKK